MMMSLICSGVLIKGASTLRRALREVNLFPGPGGLKMDKNI